ncbi:probable DNA-3-methyladenine glycosylase [Sitophilus oryzae]|uniref:DNA-3-methyladenine glycosylase n=1 Tax=Sitophilus oryzae TaxID=7048 RepID=A0A6J2YS05_SITOR|nr:probable DNA-3-methyladenine glycosylase [Sitophilus oryzae]XP_030766093.1 probable DNA-3-methyladenine glycosylase [Sitophilus oryzae]
MAQNEAIKRMSTVKRLLKPDFDRNCMDMALYLLGKVLVRKLDTGDVLKGRIVETECYLGNEDKASKSYNGRRTPANEPMYMPPGTCYVYQTYGMYHCFNVSSQEPGSAVLLRALEPIIGMDIMRDFRKAKKGKVIEKSHVICNGPAKLCISMDINKANCNKLDLGDPENDILWIEDDFQMENSEIQVVKTSRIGIDSAGEEWARKPLRFYIAGNTSVSKLDKRAEKQLESHITSPYFP